jgi:hypothetical protein
MTDKHAWQRWDDVADVLNEVADEQWNADRDRVDQRVVLLPE